MKVLHAKTGMLNSLRVHYDFCLKISYAPKTQCASDNNFSQSCAYCCTKYCPYTLVTCYLFFFKL